MSFGSSLIFVTENSAKLYQSLKANNQNKHMQTGKRLVLIALNVVSIFKRGC